MPLSRQYSNITNEEKLAAFLTFVLGHYVEEGVQDLSRDKLSDYLTIQFGSQVTGAKALGGIDKALESYIGFQAHLYYSLSSPRLCRAVHTQALHLFVSVFHFKNIPPLWKARIEFLYYAVSVGLRGVMAED